MIKISIYNDSIKRMADNSLSMHDLLWGCLAQLSYLDKIEVNNENADVVNKLIKEEHNNIKKRIVSLLANIGVYPLSYPNAGPDYMRETYNRIIKEIEELECKSEAAR